MPFSIPNRSDAPVDERQSILFNSNIDDLVQGIAGTGIASGCEVTPYGSGLTIQFTDGIANFDGSPTEVPLGILTPDAAHGSYPRIDIVEVANNGGTYIKKGVAQLNPIEPDVTSGRIKTASLFIPANLTTITANHISDRRVTLPSSLAKIGPGVVIAGGQLGNTPSVVWTSGNVTLPPFASAKNGYWIIVATDDIVISPTTDDSINGNINGTISLTNFSVAIIGKDNGTYGWMLALEGGAGFILKTLLGGNNISIVPSIENGYPQAKIAVTGLEAEDVSGLGGAALLDVGTAAGTVAAGDHVHTGGGDHTHDADAVMVDNSTWDGALSAATPPANVQAALDLLDDTAAAAGTALTNHLNDTVDAHDASAVSTTGHNGILNGDTTVQEALDTLDDHTHAASVVTTTGNSGILNGTTTVQGALDALDFHTHTRIINLMVTDPNGSDIVTGDGQAYFTVPAELNTRAISSVHIALSTAGTSTGATVQLHNVTDAVDILSTAATTDATERTSYTATTPPVVNGSNATLATGDLLRVDIDGVPTGGKGLQVIISVS